jgi:hypothetical protein
MEGWATGDADMPWQVEGPTPVSSGISFAAEKALICPISQEPLTGGCDPLIGHCALR